MAHKDKFKTVLITGASTGIGLELAHEFARAGHNLIITSRRKSTLDKIAKEIRSQHRVDVTVIVSDLAQPDGPERLLEQVDAADVTFEILINNAGVIEVGPFQDSKAKDLANLLQLNIVSLTSLTHKVVQRFVKQGYGKILNVASLAAFQPIAMMSTYAASKAFVLSLTEALSEELKGTNISVSALCPGLTKTGMVDDVSEQMGEQMPIPGIFLSDPKDVAKRGYRLCMRGGVIDVPGFNNQLTAAWAQLQPKWVTRTVSGFMGRQSLGARKD